MWYTCTACTVRRVCYPIINTMYPQTKEVQIKFDCCLIIWGAGASEVADYIKQTTETVVVKHSALIPAIWKFIATSVGREQSDSVAGWIYGGRPWSNEAPGQEVLGSVLGATAIVRKVFHQRSKPDGPHFGSCFVRTSTISVIKERCRLLN